MLARSAAVKQGVNGVIFRGACPDDHLAVVDGDKLARLGAQTKV